MGGDPLLQMLAEGLDGPTRTRPGRGHVCGACNGEHFVTYQQVREVYDLTLAGESPLVCACDCPHEATTTTCDVQWGSNLQVLAGNLLCDLWEESGLGGWRWNGPHRQLVDGSGADCCWLGFPDESYGKGSTEAFWEAFGYVYRRLDPERRRRLNWFAFVTFGWRISGERISFDRLVEVIDAAVAASAGTKVSERGTAYPEETDQ